MTEQLNLIMPGNPRYQPKDMIPIFGYDNNAKAYTEVEVASLQTLGEFGVIPPEHMALLTPDVMTKLYCITTSQVDQLERTVTKHDIRALVMLIKKILPEPLHRWVHVLLTSYDVISTAQALQFKRAHANIAIRSRHVVAVLEELVRRFAGTLQAGRTHGQHAIPITVGFWLATVLNRILHCAKELDTAAGKLVGKISGPVGAYNAQHGFEITTASANFEVAVLRKLNLQPAPISTQITPPEPIATFLFHCVLYSGALAQLGQDCRQLMRTEIAEIQEDFGAEQDGSSSMPHKRNPINFENICGAFVKSKAEYLKVLDCLTSEHQRDLVASSVMRDFPIIAINLAHQLNTLLRTNEQGAPFLARISVNETACLRNFEMSSDVMMAEPLYIALQMAGYKGDAHNLVNHTLVPLSRSQGWPLIGALRLHEKKDEDLAEAIVRIPDGILNMLARPQEYTGLASIKALQIADSAAEYLAA